MKWKKRTKIILTTWYEADDYPSLFVDIREVMKKHPIVDYLRVKQKCWILR